MAGVINAESCTGFNLIMDMLSQNAIKIDTRLLARVRAPLASPQPSGETHQADLNILGWALCYLIAFLLERSEILAAANHSPSCLL